MPSLKAFNDHVCSVIGVSPSTLYERQRALSQAGLLQRRPGRGPGSGVAANATNVSLIIASLLTSESLAQAMQIMPEIRSYKYLPIRKANKFSDIDECFSPPIYENPLLAIVDAMISRDDNFIISSITFNQTRHEFCFIYEHYSYSQNFKDNSLIPVGVYYVKEGFNFDLEPNSIEYEGRIHRNVLHKIGWELSKFSLT